MVAMPGMPTLSAPGFCFAASMRSFAVFSGEFGGTTMTWSFLKVWQIGVNDFTV